MAQVVDDTRYSEAPAVALSGVWQFAEADKMDRLGVLVQRFHLGGRIRVSRVEQYRRGADMPGRRRFWDTLC